MRTFLLNDRGFSAFAFAPDAEMVAVGSGPDINLWDLTTNQLLATHKLSHERNHSRPLRFTPDGQSLAWGNQDATIGTWEFRKEIADRKRGFGLDHERVSKLVENYLQGKIEERISEKDALLLIIPHLRGMANPKITPILFDLLEKYKADFDVLRLANYVIWYNFKKWDVMPGYRDDLLNMFPDRTAEQYRAWYKENGEKLVWDEKALKYTLKR